MKRVPVSGIGVKDLVWQALDYFKTVNEGRTFAFPHCWKDLRGTPKFDEEYEAYMASLIVSKRLPKMPPSLTLMVVSLAEAPFLVQAVQEATRQPSPT